MKRRWTIDGSVVAVLGGISIFAWIPTAILGQILTIRGGIGAKDIGWGYWVGMGVWLAPWLLVGAIWAIVATIESIPRWRLPIRRVSEPVTTDLREVR